MRSSGKRRWVKPTQRVREERRIADGLPMCRHSWRTFVSGKDNRQWVYCSNCGSLRTAAKTPPPPRAS